jgi:hypothetical protein
VQLSTRLALSSLALLSIALPAPATGRLFVVSGANLNEFNPVTGAQIGTTPITPAAGTIGTIGALCYDVTTDTMFLSSTSNDNLWTLDYTTGVATLVGPYNVGTTVVMHGLGVDDTGQLYGRTSGVTLGTYFFSIDRTTGQATAIPNTHSGSFGSLEFVRSTQTMYMADLNLDSLYTIDRVTGATTLVGPTGITGSCGTSLAYDPGFGMYATNNSGTSGIFTIDLTTGTATLLVAITGNPIASTFVTDPLTPATSFCTGDAVGSTCLACGNNGAAGRGCANSSFPNGAVLTVSGAASIAADTLALTASDVPGPGLFFQANGVVQNPITFGDGMLCAAAGIIRLGVVFPTAGVATYPGGLTPGPISVGGAPISAGDLKHYQCWYRDAAPFCATETFNLTQGLSLTWAP